MKNIMIMIGIVLISISVSYGQNSKSSGMSTEMENIELQIIRLEKQLQVLEHKRDSMEIVEVNKNLKLDEATITYLFNCEKCRYDKMAVKFNFSLRFVKVAIYCDGKLVKTVDYNRDEVLDIPFTFGYLTLDIFAPDGTLIKTVKEFKS